MKDHGYNLQDLRQEVYYEHSGTDDENNGFIMKSASDLNIGELVIGFRSSVAIKLPSGANFFDHVEIKGRNQ